MEIKFTHIALQCQDITRTRLFYQEYCGMILVPRKSSPKNEEAFWLVHKSKPVSTVLVLFSGQCFHKQNKKDYSHLGFSLPSKEEVTQISDKAKHHGILAWPATQEEDPLGYFCGIRDPEGRIVEFSYGQPINI